MTQPIRFYPLDDMDPVLEQVLAASTADETEVVWLERRRGRAERQGGLSAANLGPPRLTALVRVVESGRLGWFRTEATHGRQLEDGVRQALAMAKAEEKIKRSPVLPTDTTEVAEPEPFFDPRIARLDEVTANEFLAEVSPGETSTTLEWVESHLVVRNSHGVRRSAKSTVATLHTSNGQGPGSGLAAGSARSLERLEPQHIVDRARRLTVDPRSTELGEIPTAAVAVVLAPEAVIELLDVLNVFAFAGRTYLDGTSFLSRHRNVQVFDSAFSLSDDGTHPAGLPYPFDLEGSPKKRLDLIERGTPSTLALSRQQGAQAGLRPTAAAVGGQDALFGNLFLKPGEADEEELTRSAEGGLRIGCLERLGCFEPTQLRLRAVARGVRRIRGGLLAEPLPDLDWELNLLGALGRIRSVGREVVVRCTGTTLFGGISAPAIVLDAVDGFSPRRSTG